MYGNTDHPNIALLAPVAGPYRWEPMCPTRSKLRRTAINHQGSKAVAASTVTNSWPSPALRAERVLTSMPETDCKRHPRPIPCMQGGCSGVCPLGFSAPRQKVQPPSPARHGFYRFRSAASVLAQTTVQLGRVYRRRTRVLTLRYRWAQLVSLSSTSHQSNR